MADLEHARIGWEHCCDMPAQRTSLSALWEWMSIPARTLRRRSYERTSKSIPRISEDRQRESHNDRPFDASSLTQDVAADPTTAKHRTVLYLAYGSNLCDETFLGKRGIKPLSSLNVAVPAAIMTFDLPGIAYKEPCFANIRYRTDNDGADDKSPYHKDRWHKPLVGVVYEVTLADYAHIIATEGGGSGYQDVLIDCYALSSNPRDAVPEHPSTPSFKAHTLFDPAGHHRADPSYAQPSARYLKLITDGAMERSLPYEYQDYLHQIRSYHTTTFLQIMGAALFTAVWGPIILTIITVLAPMFARKDGTMPQWLARTLRMLFRTCWLSYDRVFKPVFGDGERTIGDDDADEGNGEDEKAPLVKEAVRRYGIAGRLDTA